ncbi:MAG: hypothetical protein PHC73_02195, partial [Immundisolibacter sp.]|nr:hypothetical protein [Immundisolibacter sp.]
MQTVTPIQPGVGTASAKESPLAGSDDGAFPATLRDALTAADGNASPPAAGNMPPPQDRAGQAAPFPAGPPPAADGSAQPALDPGPLRTAGAPAGAATAVGAADPTSPSLTPASATPPPQDRAGQAAPLPAGPPPAADGSAQPA